MYPDLSYFLHDLFGTPLDNWASAFKTFGMLLVLTFMVAGWVLKTELKRHEKSGLLKPIPKTFVVKEGIQWQDIIGSALSYGYIGLKLPFIFNNFKVFQADPSSVIFSLKGNWIIGIVALLFGAAMAYYRSEKSKLSPGKHTILEYPHEKTGNILFLAALSGLFGAKVFSILENLDSFFKDPLGELLSGSGLTIYGGLIFAFFAVAWYIRRKKIPMRVMMDIAGMAILIGYGIGRQGCHLSGDGDWGIVAAAQPSWWFLPDWMWAFDYPRNVNNDGVLMDICDVTKYNQGYSQFSVEQRSEMACGQRYAHVLPEPVYPTSVYETIISFIFFSVLWLWRKRVPVAGMIFFTYMILNGIERFFIEFIRVNPKYDVVSGVESLSQAQYISILFVIIGVIGNIYLWINRDKLSLNPKS